MLAYPITDNRVAGGALGSVLGTTIWGLENEPHIPEIDIKVNSISIEAETKKLKAKWTPELQQDIQAYQNLDAEVELTSLLSEHVALEIDQEILEDLVKGATGQVAYWSRRPGKFLDRYAGAGIVNSANESIMGADFTGNVSEWYETLLETINDVSAQIHRKTLRGGATYMVVSPEVASILEMTAGFRASVTHDEDKGEAGTVKLGTINKKWEIYVDPYFLRNIILVGRKGNSFLESGYVYAPYVPLQVTPTIFDPETFTPRKAIMTRFGRKMIRPDMFGLIVIEDMVG
ncbi:MAG: Gp23 major capsid protein [Candidatus Woesebacteria bacterium GW2011_GWB1_39_12]|uniref:Gp23 major capsid protein n=1 Tax=Candidatus Woesebacteria bacterium GW2011_GWB1_39_12 TaxID=1618574 RepID=A0A0G0Q9J3_9BACT|nr:MAG: Gp23 major capsid protein [Candidatus Woesebacteria bacterium GW2011_GWB1_39_12]